MIKNIQFLCLLILLSFYFSSKAQNNSIVKYYDSSWNSTLKDKAFYFTEFVKEDTFYKCTSYWMKSKKLNCRSFTADTSFNKFIGLLLRYYENGQVQDSSNYFNENNIFNTFHYYENGYLSAHYFYDKQTKKEISEGYDEKEQKINNFIFYQEAQFQDGENSWKNYLSKNMKAKVPVKNGAPKGSYQVIIKFIIGVDGSVISAVPETNYGFGMEQEARRIIENSPAWKPLIMFGKKANAYRRQPITFVVDKK